MSRQQGHSQQLLQVTQELAEYKGYLSEAQDELQQLQAQLVAAKRVTAASAATAVDLKLQLQQVQQQNTQLHENLQAAADAQQQLTILQQQLDLAKQQLGAAKEVSTAKQHQAQELQQQLEVQEQLHKQQEQAAAEQLASAKGHIAAAKAEVRELRRAEAAASQQLSALAADLEAAHAAEKAALADARRARAAEASRSKQLADTEEQLGKCREQLALAGDIHSQLSRLQSALQEHKRQQRTSQADAEHSKEQQTALLAELSQYKLMLSEAQEEVTRLEGDSRELQAIRRRSSSSSITLPMASTGGCVPGSMLLNSSGASVLADTGVGHAAGRAGDIMGSTYSQPQQQQVQSTGANGIDAAGNAAANSNSLVMQLYIPDTPCRPHSTHGTPRQPAAAAAGAAAAASVDLCPSSSATPTAVGAAAVTSPKLGWLASPKLSPRVSPRPSSHSSCSAGCTAGCSSSKIPAAPAARHQCKEVGNSGSSCPAAGAFTGGIGHAQKLLSSTAPAGLLGQSCGGSSGHSEQHLVSHSCRSSSSTASGQPAPSSHGSSCHGNLKSAAAAVGSGVRPLSNTGPPPQRKVSSSRGAAAQETGCIGTLSASNTPRRRSSSSSSNVAAPVPLAHALLSPRCLWTGSATAGGAAAGPLVTGSKDGLVAAAGAWAAEAAPGMGS